jgi:hypothetical protein
MLGYLIPSDHQLYRVTPLKTPFGLLIPILQSSPTRNYIHTQLFLTLCHIYTAYNLTRQYSILDVYTYLRFKYSVHTASRLRYLRKTLANSLLRTAT